MVGKSKMDRRGSGPIWFVLLAVVVFVLYSLMVALVDRRRVRRRSAQGVGDLPAQVGVQSATRLRVTDEPRPLVRAGRRPPRRAPTCATRSPRAPSRRSTSSSTRSGSSPGCGCSTSAAAPAVTPTRSPAGASRCSASTSASASSTWPREAAPPGATFERADARRSPSTREFDAAISLCQGAFGLTGGPGAPLDGDGAVLDGHGPGPATRRPPGRVGVLGLLPGALPRGRTTPSTPTRA